MFGFLKRKSKVSDTLEGSGKVRKSITIDTSFQPRHINQHWIPLLNLIGSPDEKVYAKVINLIPSKHKSLGVSLGM